MLNNNNTAWQPSVSNTVYMQINWQDSGEKISHLPSLQNKLCTKNSRYNYLFKKLSTFLKKKSDV